MKHQGFLSHGGFRWLIVAVVLSGASILAYTQFTFPLGPGGGTWLGYTLGTVGALLMLWLTMLGIRKRAITEGSWSLKAWVSAHVYLGLSLIVVVTLHTAFRLGWNLHTLTYVLMLVVIVSGVVGVVTYVLLPKLLSANRGEVTEKQMLETIRSLDRQLHDEAQPLGAREAGLVRMSVEDTQIGGGFWNRLTGLHPVCANRRAVSGIARTRPRGDAVQDQAVEKVGVLLESKAAALGLARRHIRVRTMLEAWLYIHVPITFALLAALTAHIVSVFFYW